MKTKLFFALLLSFCFNLLPSQVPQGFNYQAIARDGVTGNPITDPFDVKLAVLSDDDPVTVLYEEIHYAVDPDERGLFSIVLGQGSRIAGLASFNLIDWKVQPRFLRTKIISGGEKDLGITRIWSVPYALVADSLGGPLNRLLVEGTTTGMDNALFEVKNTTGQTVFAVYNEGVRIYVDDGDAKGSKGGFAVSSQAGVKATPQNLLVVKKDTVRIYIDDTAGKPAKGGFAVGGFSEGKALDASYLKITTDDAGIIDPAENRILWYPLKNAFLTGNVLIATPTDVGENSFATGFRAKAKGMYSQSMGYLTQALGNNSTAIGKSAVATGVNSFALGDGAQTLLSDSYAFGAGAKASGTGSYAIGSVGRDTATFLPITQATEASGNYSFAIGLGATSSGIASTAMGINARASGDAALALGVGSVASGDKATSLMAGEAPGLYSLAVGYMSKAEGKYSIAIGRGVNKPPKIVVYNHALGDYSMALGYSRANGLSSVAIGTATVNSSYGYGIGHSAYVNGDYAMGFGIGVNAQAYMSTALGMYNVVAGSATTWVSTDPLFVIGNGTSPSTTSNALTILKNGNLGIGVSNPGYLLQVGSAGDGSTARANAWNLLSDQRLKTNMVVIQDPLGKILELNGYYFNWNIGTDKSKQLGISAQEVRKVLPEIVSEGSDGYLSVDYGKLSPLIIEALKAQQKEIDDLKATIGHLEELIKSLAK